MADTLDALLLSWRSVIGGGSWRSLAKELGIIGVVRSVEITDGSNGWHPHIHAIVIARQRLEEADLVSIRKTLWRGWERAIERRLGTSSKPTETRGVRVDPVWSSDVGLYITKLAGSGEKFSSHLGHELTNHTNKTGKSGSRTVWELLAATETSVRARRRWAEYEAATKGRRCLTWSHGLREALGASPEKSDEQLSLEAAFEAERVWSPETYGELYRVWRTPGLSHTLLTIAENTHQPARAEEAIKAQIDTVAPRPECPTKVEAANEDRPFTLQSPSSLHVAA